MENATNPEKTPESTLVAGMFSTTEHDAEQAEAVQQYTNSVDDDMFKTMNFAALEEYLYSVPTQAPANELPVVVPGNNQASNNQLVEDVQLQEQAQEQTKEQVQEGQLHGPGLMNAAPANGGTEYNDATTTTVEHNGPESTSNSNTGSSTLEVLSSHQAQNNLTEQDPLTASTVPSETWYRVMMASPDDIHAFLQSKGFGPRGSEDYNREFIQEALSRMPSLFFERDGDTGMIGFAQCLGLDQYVLPEAIQAGLRDRGDLRTRHGPCNVDLLLAAARSCPELAKEQLNNRFTAQLAAYRAIHQAAPCILPATSHNPVKDLHETIAVAYNAGAARERHMLINKLRDSLQIRDGFYQVRLELQGHQKRNEDIEPLMTKGLISEMENMPLQDGGDAKDVMWFLQMQFFQHNIRQLGAMTDESQLLTDSEKAWNQTFLDAQYTQAGVPSCSQAMNHAGNPSLAWNHIQQGPLLQQQGPSTGMVTPRQMTDALQQTIPPAQTNYTGPQQTQHPVNRGAQLPVNVAQMGMANPHVPNQMNQFINPQLLQKQPHQQAMSFRPNQQQLVSQNQAWTEDRSNNACPLPGQQQMQQPTALSTLPQQADTQMYHNNPPEQGSLRGQGSNQQSGLPRAGSFGVTAQQSLKNQSLQSQPIQPSQLHQNGNLYGTVPAPAEDEFFQLTGRNREYTYPTAQNPVTLYGCTDGLDRPLNRERFNNAAMRSFDANSMTLGQLSTGFGQMSTTPQSGNASMTVAEAIRRQEAQSALNVMAPDALRSRICNPQLSSLNTNGEGQAQEGNGNSNSSDNGQSLGTIRRKRKQPHEEQGNIYDA